MFYFYFEGVAETASFRVPESHIFQETMSLPPMTAIVGMMGAALGLHFADAMDYKKENNIKVGVKGTHHGRARDLWKYRKIKSNEVISAVLTREFMTDIKMKIVFACEKKDNVEKIRDGFLDPVYALTAGTSDDLLKVSYISDVIESEIILSKEFSHTILSGDLSTQYESNIDISSLPLNENIYTPRIINLPVEFGFDKNRRIVTKKEKFTFVDTPIILNKGYTSLEINGEAIPLL